MVTVAGAGMAGLVAAARLRELGVEATVLEKGDQPGGSMLLSSGVVWRHRSLDAFREECPGGEPLLQEAIVERLDERLDWLESLDALVVARETGNPRTIGRRFEPRALRDALVRRVGDIRLGAPLTQLGDRPVILATGGFGATLARRLSLPLRASPWSVGDGLFLARRRGAGVSGGLDEFYGRALPATPARVEEADYVRLAQVYGRYALVIDDEGARIDTENAAWHENDLVQEIARRPGGRAWYVVEDETLGVHLGRTTVGDQVDAARTAGGTVLSAAELPFQVPGRYRHAVHVTASVTHTIGGLVIDRDAHVLGEDGAVIQGLYAAGVDAGGIAAGGYASGLATALVFGMAAAEAIARR